MRPTINDIDVVSSPLSFNYIEFLASKAPCDCHDKVKLRVTCNGLNVKILFGLGARRGRPQSSGKIEGRGSGSHVGRCCAQPGVRRVRARVSPSRRSAAFIIIMKGSRPDRAAIGLGHSVAVSRPGPEVAVARYSICKSSPFDETDLRLGQPTDRSAVSYPPQRHG